MKRTLLIALSAVLPMSAVMAEPSAEALNAAKTLTQTMGIDKQDENGMSTMAPMIDSLAKRLQLNEADTNELREAYKKWFTEDLDQTKLRENVVKLYAEAFTVEELKQLNEFYLSPLGQKTVQAMPQIMQKSAMLGMQEAQGKQGLLQARIRPLIERHSAKLQQPGGFPGAAPAPTPAPAPAPVPAK